MSQAAEAGSTGLPPYVSAQVQRVLGLVLVLAGHEIEGLAPSQIAQLNDCTASDVTRDLANLKHAGLAEQIETTGRWRLGPRLVQVAVRHMTAMEHAARRIDEIRNRYTRNTPAAAKQAADFLTQPHQDA